jgi:CelD/BcsL family acetyltransferase involved in cellulose biosynthesis
MYRLLDLRPRHEADWQALAESHGTIFHSLAWKRVLETSFGYTSRYLVLVDDREQVAGLLPVMIARNLRLARVAVSLPFVNHLDLCCRDEDARTALVSLLGTLPERLRVRSLELRLMRDDLATSGAAVDRSNVTFVLPLDEGEGPLLARCSAGNRNHVRKVYRRETFVADTASADVATFYALFSVRQKQLGSPAPGIAFFRRIREMLPEHSVILIVRERASGTPAAAMFLVVSGDTLYYLWGGSDFTYNRLHVNVFMYWEAIRHGIARGCRRLDLGRSSNVPAQAGTYAFKAQFGAPPTPLSYGRFGSPGPGLSEQRTRLAAAVDVWKKLPTTITGPLGSVIVRYVLP